jgi:diguanylate cyclase (GGDEF)-like protein
MDLSTLFLANVLLLSIFAIAYLAIAFQATPRAHWLSWAAANTLLAAALLGFAFDKALPELAAYLLPNALLLLGFGFHRHAARQLAQLPSGKSTVAAPACAYLVAALFAYFLSSYALAYVASNLVFTAVAIATISVYAAKVFRGLVSPIGMILAFFFLAAEGLLRTVHGLATGGPQGPGMTSDAILDLHLICALVFVSLTGAFALALSFELAADRNKEAARRDPLTDTFNRREFQARLEALLARASRDEFGLLHFDLDHFKQVNDRFGHLAGDEALVKICTEVKAHLRQADCFARLGGEEFAVLLPSISRENAIKVADRVCECIAGLTYDFAPGDFSLTASAGVYHGNGNSLTSNELLRTVDKSLYRSKEAGRNRISFVEAISETMAGDDFVPAQE